jgi:hypothetical protein
MLAAPSRYYGVIINILVNVKVPTSTTVQDLNRIQFHCRRFWSKILCATDPLDRCAPESTLFIPRGHIWSLWGNDSNTPIIVKQIDLDLESQE